MVKGLRFLLITYIFSFICFLPMWLNPTGSIIRMFFYYLGYLGPLVSIFINLAIDREPLEEFFAGRFSNAFIKKWYIFAIFYGIIPPLSSLIFVYFSEGATVKFNTPVVILPLALMLGLYFSSALNEIGWRGYLFYHIKSDLDWLLSSILTGFFQAIWFYPIMMIGVNFINDLSFFELLIIFTSSSILLGWIFTESGYNFLGVIVIQWMFYLGLDNFYFHKYDQGKAIFYTIHLLLAFIVILRRRNGLYSFEELIEAKTKGKSKKSKNEDNSEPLKEEPA